MSVHYRCRIIYVLLLFLATILSRAGIVFADTTQNVNLSLSIPPQASDYQFSFTPMDGIATFQENTQLTYQILYGAKARVNQYTAITLVANFSNDTAANTDLLEYVAGSATDGYDNEVPVIDLSQKTITWTIPALPAGVVNQVVEFKLQTNNDYTDTDAVPFSIIASMTGQADQIISQSYQYVQPQSAKNTGPTTTPLPVPTATPSPMPIHMFSGVIVRQITAQSASLAVSTTIPARLKALYGTSPLSLSSSLADASLITSHLLSLQRLQPHTKYYVKIVATDVSGNEQTSDLFAFTTANVSVQPRIMQNSLIITSNDIVLSAYSGSVGMQHITVPEETFINFHFQVQNDAMLANVQALLRNNNILGTSTISTPDILMQNLVETANRLYTGRLQMPETPGIYLLVIRLADRNGTITETPIGQIYINQALTVQDDATYQPIENAQVTLYYKHLNTGRFDLLPPALFPIKNPSYTNSNGQITIALPNGTYQAVITAIGYRQKTIPFTLGTANGQTYPTILLRKDPFALMTSLTYYWTIISDALQLTKTYVQSVAASSHFFVFNAILVSALLVLLTILSFSARIHIPLRAFFSYFLHLGRMRTGRKDIATYIRGRVYDQETHTLLSGTIITLVDEADENILGMTTTDRNGRFQFPASTTHRYAFIVSHLAYAPRTFIQSGLPKTETGTYIIELGKHVHNHSFVALLYVWLRKVFGMLFEFLLLVSLVFEVAFGFSLGFEKVLIFLLFSCMNILLWLLHLSHLRSEKGF